MLKTKQDNKYILCKLYFSNKNDDDDDEDDQTCKMNEEPDLSKIMMDIERRETVLYKRSG